MKIQQYTTLEMAWGKRENRRPMSETGVLIITLLCKYNAE